MMNKNNNEKAITKHIITKYFLLFFLTVALVFFDQLTKFLAYSKLKGKAPFVIIKDVFEFHYLNGGNKGMAWGLFQGQIPMFIALTSVLMIVIIVFLIKTEKIILTTEKELSSSGKKYFIFQLLLILLLSGAIGNLIDRIYHGYVIDFIYFKLINFPIFNIADCYVTITEILLIIMFVFVFSEEETNNLLKKNKS